MATIDVYNMKREKVGSLELARIAGETAGQHYVHPHGSQPALDPASQVEGDDQVRTGLLPAGRYATVVHTGHPDTLVTATRDLLDWAAERGFDWDADGNTWGCRLEEYLSDPDEVPDMNEWQTRLAFRLRD